jgi:uncharacterized membrane protein YdjX (TVP38/TMEM64 family)
MLSDKVSVQLQTYGAPALFFITLILDLIPQIISPVVAMITAIVIGMNIYLAIIATILGSTIGSFIGFMLGKKYMFDAVNAMASKKSIDRLTDLTNKYGKIIVPLAAISPIPYLPVLLGAINLSKKNFIIYGLIPRTIGIILFGYITYLF